MGALCGHCKIVGRETNQFLLRPDVISGLIKISPEVFSNPRFQLGGRACLKHHDESGLSTQAHYNYECGDCVFVSP